MIDRVLYLKQIEWFILLDKAGLDKTICFENLSLSEMSDHEISEAVFSLIARGLIKRENERFRISDKLIPYVDSLMQAKHCIVGRLFLDSYPMYCAYLSDTSVLKVEMDYGTDSRIALRLSTIGDFLEEESGYDFMPSRDCILPEVYVDYSADTVEWEKEFGNDSSMLMLCKLYNSVSCELEKTVFVKRDALCDIIVIKTKDGAMKTVAYSKQVISDLLCGIAGEENSK